MLEKIDDENVWVNKLELGCHHPEHKPPMHIVLENGKYKHTCPACGKVTVLTVSNPTLSVL